MCRDARTGMLLVTSLVFTAMNFGCGGGGVPPTAQINQSPQTESSSTQAMQVPTLGFAYAVDGTEIRTIHGIPGASAQGLPLALPAGVTGIEFAPGQKSAIVERGNASSVGVISFAGAAPGPVVPIAGAISHADIIAFNPKGNGAAIYSASEGRLQVISGIPDNPQIIRQLASGDLPAAAHLLALADDGVTLLEGTINSAVYLLASGGPQLINNLSDLEGMVFTPNSNNALIFDRVGGALSLVQNVNSAPSTRMLANNLTGLEGTIVLATDGRRAALISTNANRLWEVDLGSLRVQNVQLPAAPSMLKPLRISGDYLLSWQPGQLAWIVDTNQAQGAVYPVPVAVTAGSNP